MKILYVLHADFELPGAIEIWAQEHHFDTQYCKPFKGEKLPSSSAFDLLIVMGGPQSSLKVDQFPYLKEEIVLIRETLQVGKPVLGFCLGAQLLGEALGARAEKSPHKEVGVFPIHLTSEGRQDPLLAGLPEKLFVVHWHNDMPGLTGEAKILAKSSGCPRQIVRYTPKAYGFQCHPEPTLENIQAMIQHCPEDLASGTYVQSVEQFLKNNFNVINYSLITILENLLETNLLVGQSS